MPVVVLAVIMLGGCGRIAALAEPVSVFHPVWAADGWVYYLREVSSEGAEVWRQRHDEGNEELVLGRDALAPVCAKAHFSFLFGGAGSDVGLGVECDGGGRTELLSYTANDEKLEPRASLPFLGGAVLVNGDSGYVEVPRRCGFGIQPVIDGTVRDFPSSVTVEGKTFNVSGGDSNCRSVALVRSPAAVEDRLFFMAAPDSLGRLPRGVGEDLEDFTWRLTEWNVKSGSVRILTEIPGIADLAVSPDRRSVIAAVGSPEDKAGVWSVDVGTGEKTRIVDDEEAYHPSFSPDGKWLVYVEKLRHLKFRTASGHALR
ncbi:hypothetical protein OG470_06110 [Micromonospora sp. NBC_00389]|uniref:TolB family protein n=1 Tax=Micromonospora sp. NBC_00389 TaxID=2903586 RepID=UPI002E1CD6E6